MVLGLLVLLDSLFFYFIFISTRRVSLCVSMDSGRKYRVQSTRTHTHGISVFILFFSPFHLTHSPTTLTISIHERRRLRCCCLRLFGTVTGLVYHTQSHTLTQTHTYTGSRNTGYSIHTHTRTHTHTRATRRRNMCVNSFFPLEILFRICLRFQFNYVQLNTRRLDARTNEKTTNKR